MISGYIIFISLFSFLFYRFHLFSFHFTMFYALILFFLCFQVIICILRERGTKSGQNTDKAEELESLHTKTRGLLQAPVMAITGCKRACSCNPTLRHPNTKTRGLLRAPVMAIKAPKRKASFLLIYFLFWLDSVHFKAFDYLDMIFIVFNWH